MISHGLLLSDLLVVGLVGVVAPSLCTATSSKTVSTSMVNSFTSSTHGERSLTISQISQK